jgi:steroid 5-alpha reductase family enzyme
MSENARRALIAIPVALALGAGMAFAGGRGGTMAFGISLFALLVGLAFIVQWLAFVPAFLGRTERFFDLMGSVTYILVTLAAALLAPRIDASSILLSAVIVIWAARLGFFLFRRIRREGRDARFDEIRSSFARFLTAWTLQGLWVTITASAGLAAITSDHREALGWPAAVGLLLWGLGFAIEVVADSQKRRFRASPENAGRFIQTGLWARSRHPNYFGEILLWIGVAVIAFPALGGWQRATLISPVFVILLLTRVSGVPLLEERADAKWGGQAEYEAYKEKTPVLVPTLRGSGVRRPRERAR